MKKLSKHKLEFMPKKDKIMNDFPEFSKKNSFVVPEGYFDNFSEHLSKRMLAEEETLSRRNDSIIKILFNSKLALAASILLFISVSYFTIQEILNRNTSSESQYYSELIDHEIADYDLGLLAEFYVEDEESSVQDLDSEAYEDSEIIDFLITEDIDIEMIIEQL